MFQGIQGIAAEEQPVSLTLFTDAFVVRGMIRTRQRRITDILNEAEHAFIVLNDVVMDEYGSRSVAVRADYAQVNLASVLFAVADTPVDPTPELRTPKVAEQAMVSIPPFRIIGRIHLLPERDMRQALSELTGRFLPVTDAAYWSDIVGEARTTSPMVAFNHARAQILAPHREVDPWEGLDRSAGQAAAGRAPDAIGEVPAGVPSTSMPTGAQDPWGAGTTAGAGGVTDPWRDVPASGAGEPSGGAGGDPWGAGRPPRDDELIG